MQGVVRLSKIKYPIRDTFCSDDHPLTDGVFVKLVKKLHGNGTHTMPGTEYQKLTAILNDSSSSDGDGSQSDTKVAKLSGMMERCPSLDKNLEEKEPNLTSEESDSSSEQTMLKRRKKRSKLSNQKDRSKAEAPNENQKPQMKNSKENADSSSGSSQSKLLANDLQLVSRNDRQKSESISVQYTCSSSALLASDSETGESLLQMDDCDSSEVRLHLDDCESDSYSQMNECDTNGSLQSDESSPSSPNPDSGFPTSSSDDDCEALINGSPSAASGNFTKDSESNFVMPHPSKRQLTLKWELGKHVDLLAMFTNPPVNQEMRLNLRKLEKSAREFVRKMYTLFVNSLIGKANLSRQELYFIASKLENVRRFALHEISSLSQRRVDFPLRTIKNEFFLVFKNQVLLMCFAVLKQISKSLIIQFQESEADDKAFKVYLVRRCFKDKTKSLRRLRGTDKYEEFIETRVAEIVSLCKNPPDSEQDMIHEVNDFVMIDEIRYLLMVLYVTFMKDFPFKILVDQEFTSIFPLNS